MLFWAVFTLGYIIGTLFTLAFFFKRSEVGELNTQFVEKGDFAEKDSWEKFNDLIRINFTKNKNKTTKERNILEKHNSRIAVLN